ncbi:MAG TPA: hypothetical protein VFI26_08685 [Lysobacter sp.]|nr:hypothetical protein [Lysobacter sp.]
MLVFIVAFLGQWPLVANPGYFSHDELQWASYADARTISWTLWTDVHAFQYRPLTFNSWLLLSRLLFAQPFAFHAVMVAWGAGNAVLVHALGRRFGMAALPAAIGALVFALGPFATYTDGWVGTIGDLAWLSCALLAGLAAMRWPRAVPSAVAATIFTTLAFLAKEAAISIPALLALAWWFDGRKRHWLAATAASSLVAFVYLVLRLGTLLHGAPGGSQYVADVANVPSRWLEYQLFLFVPKTFETIGTLAFGLDRYLVAAGILWLGMAAAMWRSGPRHLWLFLAGGIATLAPALLLGSSANQYGYGFAAIGAMVAAASWRRAPRWGRTVLVLCALACAWHGKFVIQTMRHVGEVQAVFSPALADAVHGRGDAPLRLRPAPGAEAWIFSRLTQDVPSYRGVPIDDRVSLVSDHAAADFVILANGELLPTR